MKKIFALILFVTFLIFLEISAQSNGDKSAIMNLMMKQQDAWNHGNIEAYMDAYWKNDSLQFIGKRGITHGWKNTLENYKKSYPDTVAMGQLKLDIISVDVLSSQSAFVVGKWFLSREKT